MSSERDKNWERVLRTAIGFGKKHGRWPTRLLIDPGILRALERGFAPEDYRTFTGGIEIVPTPDRLRAETDDGDAYDYGDSLATRLTFTVSDPRPAWLHLDLAAASPESEPAAVAVSLEALVRDWHAAIRRKDTDALERLWAEDYAAVGPDGRVSTRAEEIEAIRSADLHFDVLDVDDLSVREIGDLAVVRSRTKAKGTFRGQLIDASYRNTQVFARRDGRWAAVAAHSTAIAP